MINSRLNLNKLSGRKNQYLGDYYSVMEMLSLMETDLAKLDIDIHDPQMYNRCIETIRNTKAKLDNLSCRLQIKLSRLKNNT